ncbi:hypothetical protein [Alteromonas facilis]|uniref:hypothetical protein n=1 Tax=Alteromonas facilis TaxID=2048004 RepID=UPI000C28AABE|nr:hypothetical protein [Alteromonas facilis]
MNIRRFLFLTLLFTSSLHAQVSITTVHENDDELKIKSDLEFLHEEYDLSPWLYTQKVRVNSEAKTPHSHPVLTMSTQPDYLKSKVKLLSSYLHEQFHWHVIMNGKATKEAFRARIKERFPNVKTGHPHGSRDEGSTLSHIVVCYLEYIALTELVGQEKAFENISTNGYYTWVYETVSDPKNKDVLDSLLSEFGLEFRVGKNESAGGH